MSARERGKFNLLFMLEHYFPDSAALKRARAAVHDHITEQVRSGGAGKVIPVARRRDLSPEEFQRDYLRTGVPVLIEGGAKSWPLMSRWSIEQFKARFGHESIKLVQRKGLADDDFVDEREYSEEMNFGDFLDQVLTGGRKYMRFSPLLEKFPELLGDFDHAFFKRMVDNVWGSSFQLFIGGKGTLTPMHNAITPFFFLNVAGQKRWVLVPNQFMAVLNPNADGFGYNHTEADFDAQDLARFPALDSVDRMEVVMQPGDLLFVPSWMWHCVENQSPTIGVRCGFMYPAGMVRESATLAFVRLFAARNPTTLEWIYYSLFKTNLPVRERLLITPKWWLGKSGAARAKPSHDAASPT